VTDQDDISLLNQKDSADLSASQIDKLLGADYVITGNVQSFDSWSTLSAMAEQHLPI
jgi:hypothetical protein